MSGLTKKSRIAGFAAEIDEKVKNRRFVNFKAVFVNLKEFIGNVKLKSRVFSTFNEKKWLESYIAADMRVGRPPCRSDLPGRKYRKNYIGTH